METQDTRELFLLFAIKRKIKLLSFLVINPAIKFKFREENFIDILENHAYDIGVLLYREYFLEITTR